MSKKAYFVSHLSSSELKRCYQQSTEPVESRRWHLVWLVSTDWSIKQAAKAVGLNYDYAKEIVHGYNQKGPEALSNRRKTRRAGGRRALLNGNQLEELRQALHQPPADGGLWSGPKVAQWIAQKTKRQKVWEQRGWEYLRRCRFSPPAASASSCESGYSSPSEIQKRAASLAHSATGNSSSSQD